MERYKNLGGNSTVIGFEYGMDYIRVYFGDGSTYLYTNQSAGAGNIVKMKSLALAGSGLNSFIKRVVPHGYASKTR